MYKKNNYYRGSHCKYKLTVHLIFVTKYRQKILYDKLKVDLNNYILTLAIKYDWYIQILESDKDHIHILLDYKPTDTISNIVKILKQMTTNEMWKLHPELKSIYWHKEKLFWSNGYFACSIGDASNEIIKQYIANQG